MSSTTKAKAAPASTVAPPAANTSKRDYLIELEHAAQKRWAEEKMFETDSPYSDGTLAVPEQDFAAAAAKAREERPKWMGTFPYPVSPRARSARISSCESWFSRLSHSSWAGSDDLKDILLTCTFFLCSPLSASALVPSILFRSPSALRPLRST